MQSAAQQRDLYPNSQDGHPTGVGYRVIAEATWNYLRDSDGQVERTQ